MGMLTPFRDGLEHDECIDEAGYNNADHEKEKERPHEAPSYTAICNSTTKKER